MTKTACSLVIGFFLFATTVGAQDRFVPFKAKFIERVISRNGTDRSYKEKIIFRNSEGSMFHRTSELDPATKEVIRRWIQIDSPRDSTTYIIYEKNKIAHTFPLSQPPDPKVAAAILERRKQSGWTTRTFLGRPCYIVPLRRSSRGKQYGGEVFQDMETGFYLHMEGRLPNFEKEVTEAVEFVVEEAEPWYFEPPDLTGYQVNP